LILFLKASVKKSQPAAAPTEISVSFGQARLNMKVVRVSSKPLTATMSLNGIESQRCAQQIVGVLADAQGFRP